MTASQKKIVDRLSKRITKEESIDLGFEIVPDPEFTKIIFEKLQNEDERPIMNILWALRSLQPQELALFPQLLTILLDLFKKFAYNETIKRECIGLFQDMVIPEEKQSQIYDLCFSCLQNSSEPIAIKAFSMSVCYNIAEPHPELLRELALQIEESLIVYGDISPAIFSRGTKILKQVNRRLRK